MSWQEGVWNTVPQTHVTLDVKLSGCNAVCRFVTFEQDSSVEQVFRMGAMHELAGKRVEVKSATPRGSGPVTPIRNLPMGRVWAQRPMAGRGMGLYPGQIPQAGFMGPYGPVG